MPQLTYTECVQIQVLLEEKYSHRKIAVRLWFSNGTISREVKKYSIEGIYNAKTARLQRKVRRCLVNTLLHERIKKWSELEKYILEKVKEYRSPDQIVWERKGKYWWKLSVSTIYKYIKTHHKWMIKKYFRRKWKEYKYNYEPVGYIYDRISIHERPKIEWMWHWEWDTIVWKWHKWVIVTFNEIKSWYLLAMQVPRKQAKYITQAARELFKKIPEELRKTLTLDNWREFCEHFMLRWLCWFDTYFADPWNPWQRWANENLNGLLRQFYPKWTSLLDIDPEKLQYYVNLLNNRPRKRLWYISPIQFLKNHGCVLLD